MCAGFRGVRVNVMTQNRAWAFGASALWMLISMGILGFGCANQGVTGEGNDVPCIAEKEQCGDDFDNDCDGKIDIADSDCTCKTGDKQPCYTGDAATRA